jgi:hypothetical protein
MRFPAILIVLLACDHKPADPAPTTSIAPQTPASVVASAASAASAATMFSKPPTVAHVLAWFMHEKLPISANDIAEFNEDTDKNKLLGRPHQYTAKGVWRDPRTGEEGEPDLGTGGTVEIFDSEADATTRFDYVEKITASSPLLTEYHYRRGTVLVRVSSKLKPSQAKEYETALQKLP